MLRYSTVASVVVRKHPREIPLAKKNTAEIPQASLKLCFHVQVAHSFGINHCYQHCACSLILGIVHLYHPILPTFVWPQLFLFQGQ